MFLKFHERYKHKLQNKNRPIQKPYHMYKVIEIAQTLSKLSSSASIVA